MPAKTTGPKPAKPKKPPPTPEERKAAAQARKAAAEAKEAERQREIEARRLAFEAIRAATWYELFAKALRVRIIQEDYPHVVESNDWWFRAFHADARQQTLSCEDAYSREITLETLQEHNVKDIHRGLDQALRWFVEYDEEQERERLAAIAREERRQLALSKLDAEDRKVLGIRDR